MKFTIEGFSQRKVLSLRDEKQKVDCVDLVLLRWFIDFKDTPKMKYCDINGNRYYWVNYEKILLDLPILSISKRAIYDRFQKLVKFGILTHYHVKDGGSFSYYGVGEVYESLISESSPYEDNFQGGMKSTSEGVGSQLPSKDSSIKDYSINNKYSPYIPQEDDSETELVVSKKQDHVEEFDFFYSLYPRHESKSTARKAWNKLNPSAELQKIMLEALMKQKKSEQWNRDNGKFIPYPATWINQRRWEDEINVEDPTESMFDRVKKKAIQIDRAIGNENSGQGGFWDGIE